MNNSGPESPHSKKSSLGVIFLTLYIDLIGFSIIFPLLPDLIGHYLHTDGTSGLLGYFLGLTESFSHSLGKDSNFAAVLFGGIVGSLFSIMQFLFAPIWGGISDRLGRRPVLLWTVCGTALGYLLWVLSGSFWVFVLSRLVCGVFGGNLSVATAAVADITSRADRSKAMGLVGAAFGLGLVTGPMLGAFLVKVDLSAVYPSLQGWGLNPFSLPALVSLFLSILNLIWISRRFGETLDSSNKTEKPVQERNALKAILSMENPMIRKTNLVAFVFSVAFVSMELSLTYLAAERFGYTASQNGLLLGFLGFCSIITQGVVVRRMLKTMPETRVLRVGLVCALFGFVGIGVASAPWVLYSSLVLLALGSGLINPSTSGLISLYSSANEQGRVLGVFRSLGALSRAITPVLAGLIYWSLSSSVLYGLAAIMTLGAMYFARTLPIPEK